MRPREAAKFFKSYFTAKSEHKPVPTTDHFSEAHLTYIDAALGWPFYSKKGMTDLFEQYMPKWPPTGPFLSDPHQRRHPFGAGRLHRYAGAVRW